MGSGGIAYLNYAARVFSDEKFRDYYEHRAAHLLALHGESLIPLTVKSLQTLIPRKTYETNDTPTK
jgi:hypothetical protein